MVGAISCCFRVEGGHVHVTQLLFNIFKTKIPTTVPQNSSCFFFLVHYEST